MEAGDLPKGLDLTPPALLLLLISVTRVAFVRLWIAVAPGEARVTIRYMYRAFALVLVAALAFVACGDEESGPTQEDLDAARAAASEAAEAVDRLETRVESLEDDLASADDAAADVAARLRKATKSLRASLGDLRASLGDIRATASDAVSSAEAAAGQVGAVARDLSVLEDRFNFHLSKHGG